jgi:hypothetical protein
MIHAKLRGAQSYQRRHLLHRSPPTAAPLPIWSTSTLRYPPPHDVHAFPLHQRLSCSPKWILSHLQHVSSQYDVLSAPLTLFTSVNQAVCSAKLHISPCFPDTRLPRVVALCTNCQLYTKFAPLLFPRNSCKLPPPPSSLFLYPPFVT